VRDLWRWTTDPIGLISGRPGPFTLRLWRTVHIGHSPAWNRAVLTDLETFASAGSLSALTPYLNGGVVQLDQPGHDPRRRELNPHFHSKALPPLAAEPPPGDFDALDWAGVTVQRMLNSAFFGGLMPPRLLAAFVHPLEKPLPAPLRPRPVLFRRVTSAIKRILQAPPPGTIAEALASHPNAAEELRIGLAAGYDTTTHTLAWALWHLAGSPEWQTPAMLPSVIDETLRLYPAGWIGSRVATRDSEVDGVRIARGTMVCYSPYLTHRDPELWPDPLSFRPQRFPGRPQPWTYLPFSSGSRTCLGMHLARHMLITALTAVCEHGVSRLDGDPGVRAGLTIRPRGPLRLRLAPAPA
jgi:cytochrome P450